MVRYVNVYEGKPAWDSYPHFTRLAAVENVGRAARLTYRLRVTPKLINIRTGNPATAGEAEPRPISETLAACASAISNFYAGPKYEDQP